MKRFFLWLKWIFFLGIMRVFSAVPYVGNTLRLHANNLLFREEHVVFPEFSLCGIDVLFLTDPHIGGSIDPEIPNIAAKLTSFIDERKHLLVLHGGDFLSSQGGKSLEEKHILAVSKKLFSPLTSFPHCAVIGNHDEENPLFPQYKKWLTDEYDLHFLIDPEDKKIFSYPASIAVHGLHTLAIHLHTMEKERRDTLLDALIAHLSDQNVARNIVLIHNPDGLEFLLQRLLETQQFITIPTLFLSGHTHGGMFDVAGIRKLGLWVCKTSFGRYKGWYEPEGKYKDTGNWKLYVSSGMGNSPGFDLRSNAQPEVVLFHL